MKKAACIEHAPSYGGKQSLTFWDQIFLKAANDNAMPWRKKMAMLALWGGILSLGTLFSFFF